MSYPSETGLIGTKNLVAINAVSQQEYDDATAALKQAEADIQVNKAATETAHINLAYTRVTAPITGRIGKSNVTVGALVTANQPTPLTTNSAARSDLCGCDPVKRQSAEPQKEHIAAGRIKGRRPQPDKGEVAS